MNNKEIQESRMKGYFIRATKEIIKSEGLQHLSVRNIATQAGYSFATLYNYFKDVNELVFLCVSDFQEECAVFVEAQVEKNSQLGVNQLKAKTMAYINYFIEYPSIFDLFYLNKMNDFGKSKPAIEIINTSLEDICRPEWDYCIAEKIIPEKEANFLKADIKYAVIGLLLLYMNRMLPDNYNEFIKRANTQINRLLDIAIQK